MPDWSDQYGNYRPAGVLQTDIVIRGLPFSIISVGGARNEKEEMDLYF